MSVTLGPDDDLMAAVSEARDGAVICLRPGTYVATLRPTVSLVIKGLGPGPAIIDADRVAAVVSIEVDNIEVRLENLTLTGGSAPLGGGVALVAMSKLSLSGCQIHNCNARQGGGAAVYADIGELQLDRCRVSGGESKDGSAVLIDGIADVSARTCLFTGKVSAGKALVRVRDGAALTLGASTIAASGPGFAAHVSGTTSRFPEVVIKDSIVSGADAPALDPSSAIKGSVRATRSILSRADAETYTDFGAASAADPEFTGSDDEPYRVAASSPAVGMATSTGSDLDLTGRPRPAKAAAGAFEP